MSACHTLQTDIIYSRLWIEWCVGVNNLKLCQILCAFHDDDVYAELWTRERGGFGHTWATAV